jgi:glycosyltransferase involved in cell wall biosynthesis
MICQVVVIGGGGKHHLSVLAESLAKANMLQCLIVGGYPKSGLKEKLIKFGKPGIRLNNRKVNLTEKKIIDFWFAEVFWQVAQRLDKCKSTSGLYLQKILAITFLLIFEIQTNLHLLVHYKRYSNSVFLCRSGYSTILFRNPLINKNRIILDHSIAQPDFLVAKGIVDTKNPFWRKIKSELHVANKVIVNSDFVKKTCIESGIHPNKLFVAYLTPPPFFLSCTRTYVYPHRLRLLFAGTIEYRKGIDHLHTMLAASNRTWDMTIVGDFQGEVAYLREKFLKMEGVSLRPLLNKDELLEAMLTHDAFLFPTRAEGSARVVTEAMATGMPVITTDFCGAPGQANREWLRLDLTSTEPLLLQVEKLLANRQLLTTIGLQAKELMQKYVNNNSYFESVLIALNTIE